MLDNDVDMLYQYETKNIDKAVKRNIERFSEDFCFQYIFLISHIIILYIIYLRIAVEGFGRHLGVVDKILSTALSFG